MLDIQAELVKFKNAELTCLGISPPLYYSAVKLLGRHIIVVFKNDILYQFINESNPQLHPKITPHDKRVTYEDSINLLTDAFGISQTLAAIIVAEWKRSKRIESGMYKNLSKYWKYISLPYGNLDT